MFCERNELILHVKACKDSLLQDCCVFLGINQYGSKYYLRDNRLLATIRGIDTNKQTITIWRDSDTSLISSRTQYYTTVTQRNGVQYGKSCVHSEVLGVIQFGQYPA